MVYRGGVLFACVLLLAVVPAPAGSPDNVPSDAMLVIDVDVSALIKSDLYRLLGEQLDSFEEANEAYVQFQEATGFDPESDLHRLTIAVGEVGEDDAPVYVIISGKFDREKLEHYAVESGEVTVGKLGDRMTFAPSNITEGDEPPPILTLIDSSTLLMASSEEHLDKLVQSAGGSSRGANSKLRALLSAAKGEITMAMIIPEAPAKERGGQQTAEPHGFQSMVQSKLSGNPQTAALASLRTLSLSIDVSRGVEMDLVGAADTAENGKLIHDTLNGFVVMAKMMTAQDPDSAKMLDRLTLSQDGPEVSLSLSMTLDELMALSAQAAAMQGATSGP